MPRVILGLMQPDPQKGSVMATAMAGAIAHLAYGLAIEVAPVRVNAVFPGGIETEIWDAFPPHLREAEQAPLHQAARAAHRPARRGRRSPCLYVYLMKGGYTTGQILQVDGGSALAG